MPRLHDPTVTVRSSFRAAVAEFQVEGRGDYAEQMLDHQPLPGGEHWSSVRGFAEYVRLLCAQAHEDTPRQPGRVPWTTLWWIDGDEYLGRVAIRHRLTPHLERAGGHIGYDVRPAARRRGHATAMLRAALPRAHDLGIDPALVTCDADNVASRLVIEHNGGILEDRRDGKLRFWTPTG